MQIVLISNFLPDKQESMQRFAHMLELGYKNEGHDVSIWRPKAYFSKWSATTNSGLGKWLGYIDKWVIFQWVLFFNVSKKADVRYHICDHSNSPYLKHLPADKTIITCHDVIAIRGGLGFNDTYQPTSSLGKKLQQWILSYLAKAKLLVSVSDFTLEQLTDILGERKSSWKVIHNAFNANFSIIPKSEAATLLKMVDPKLLAKPFLLHVGSELARKNRKLLLDMLAALGDKWDGNVCFAGKPIDSDLEEHVKQLGLQDRVISVVGPGHDTLVALYNACEAFIFPSFAEGFGWPIIEGQACGTPVITSNVKPLFEVSGHAAMHEDPANASDFARAFLQLKDNDFRSDIIKKGLENVKRFEPSKMISAYLNLFN